MAKIVLGVGTTHGPLLATPPEAWDGRARVDRANPELAFRDGTYDFPQLHALRKDPFVAGSPGGNLDIVSGATGTKLATWPATAQFRCGVVAAAGEPLGERRSRDPLGSLDEVIPLGQGMHAAVEIAGHVVEADPAEPHHRLLLRTPPSVRPIPAIK
jgi:hypothetical protein